MRAPKFLSRWKQYYLCLNSQSQLSASASPFLQAAPAVALPVASARATLLRVDRRPRRRRLADRRRGRRAVELLLALQAALSRTPTPTPTPTQHRPSQAAVFAQVEVRR